VRPSFRAFVEGVAKLGGLSDVKRSERVQETQRVFDKYFTDALHPDLQGVKVKAVPTWFGLGAPDVRISAKNREGKNIFTRNGFSYGTGDASFHKGLSGKYTVEGDAMYLRPEMRARGIGSAMFKALVGASAELGATKLRAQADEQGKHVWAKMPGVQFQAREARTAPRAYAKWRKQHGGPELARDATPGEYPTEFLRDWVPNEQLGVPFIGYQLPLKKGMAEIRE